ncbi:MAG TPA: hypothetical protein D7I03_06965 [Candidatus Poseidoniales archaeon]|nr:MAG TPA: hypothetical protein D7I03_06965 [Candidatus Poseidoniales archaeon]HII51067.1 hypothetical protein [Candidatus Poseidoniaceae archaeon]
MTEQVIEGASLPEGIEVDETSAYFGITKSSDIVHQLMSMDRNQSIVEFFGMVSDIVLKPGDFDFEEASKILNCEGGEIYFLVSGHLGLMSFSDPILHYLGLPNSLGEDSPNGKPTIGDTQFESIKRLADPMNILKVLAIAQTTGGSDEVMKYYLTMSKILQDVNTNSTLLAEIAEEFDASLDVIGHAIPISNLANSTIDTSDISTTSSLKPEPTKIESEPKPVENVPISTVKSADSIAKTEQTVSVPLPGKSTPIKEEPVEEIQKAVVEAKITDRKAAKVTDNAFEGAFGMAQSGLEDVVETVEKTETNEADVVAEESIEEQTEKISNLQEENTTEEPFVSAAEMFIQSDKDDDGTLSVEELADATGLSIEESKELHKEADKDDDGKMSLSEFVASPVVEKVAANLPRPVAPVRKPVNRAEPKPNQQQNTPPQNLAPQPVVSSQPINQAPPQMPQQPMWNQPVQPTIRSGVNCRGCGIGIDPFWRFCPVCGSQNLN